MPGICALDLGAMLRMGPRLSAAGGGFRQRFERMGAFDHLGRFGLTLSVNAACRVTESITVEVEVRAGLMVAPGGAAQAEVEARPVAMVPPSST